jgi:asparagine synthase (glutamine-hydrolysing)
MCGIAVALRAKPSPRRAEHVVATLRHRGPDGSGVYEDEDIFVGHTRLAIIELSDAGAQPMQSPDGRFVLAYNGEIFNHRELREGIGARGWPWRGDSDTEVLLALLAREGVACLERLRGMFAFVLWDRDARTVLAARDHLGIKPLYYSVEDASLRISSELRGICALGGAATLDDEAVATFLVEGAVAGPRTILEGVRALPPAHFITAHADQPAIVHERRYWELPPPAAIDKPEQDFVERVDDALRETVRLELRSDVPLGVFLSGGLDSSLVASYAADELGEDLHTFSVGFETVDARLDETGAASRVAKHLRSQHERVVVHRSEFVTQMRDVVAALDQPSVDGINSYFISSAAARSVKVALSGQGGDELFGGYNTFPFASKLANLTSHFPVAPLRVQAFAARATQLPARVQHNWYVRGAVGALTDVDPAVLVAMSNPVFAAREVGVTPRHFSADAGANRCRDVVNEISRIMVRGYLVNTLLRDMDATSMAHSLEVRVPLVDRVLLTLAFRAPGWQKVVWGNTKMPLRTLVGRRLPTELLHRPKQGFTFPLADWLAHPMTRPVIDEILDPDRIAAVGRVSPDLVRHEVDRLRHPRRTDIRWLRAQRVWALIVLHEWHQHWDDRRRQARTIG